MHQRVIGNVVITFGIVKLFGIINGFAEHIRHETKHKVEIKEAGAWRGKRPVSILRSNAVNWPYE